jgi:Uma2 family endonuclease
MTETTTFPPLSGAAAPVREDPLQEVTDGHRVVEPAGRGWDDDTLYETVQGRRVEKPPMGFYECSVASILVTYLGHFALTNRLGRVVGEGLFRIDAARGLERRPDVAFVSYRRWPRDRKMLRTNAWEVVPDLAVEVISKTNLAEEVLIKVDEYFQAGVELVWIIYPVQGYVYVYESPTRVRILTRQDELDGGTVLPGFRLPVATLLADELESEEEARPVA